jgi:hypothetical protein
MSESIDKACRSNYSTLHLGQTTVPDMCTLSIHVPCQLRRQLQRAQQDMWEDARVELGAMVWSDDKPWVKSVVKLRICPSLCDLCDLVNTQTHSRENTPHTHKELHGEHHPSVTIRFGAEPLVASGQGRMELRFCVAGDLIGFKYRIVLQEVDILVYRVIQQQETSFSLIDISASTEITTELAIMDSTKSDRIKFAIGVWDAHAGLSEEEALVARYDASFPLLKREHALTTDTATEWYGSGPPKTPPAAAAPLATAQTLPRHLHAAPTPPALTSLSRRCDTGSDYDDAVCVPNRLNRTETNELHGEHHPSVAIRFCAEPLVASGQGRMELRFCVVGDLIGFKYRIVLQEVDILVYRVIQHQETNFRPTEYSVEASTEITANLDIMYTRHYKTDRIKFAIGVWDSHTGLSDDEALVGRTEASFCLLKCEYGLTTDNLCRLVNRTNMGMPSGMREPDHEPPKNPSVIVFLYLPSFEISKDLEVCVQVVERLSPVLRNAYEVRVLVAWFIESEVPDRIRNATTCLRVSFIHPRQMMDRILTPVGGAIVIMSDDLIYPIDYLDRALEIVRGAAQSIRENVVIGPDFANYS